MKSLKRTLLALGAVGIFWSFRITTWQYCRNYIGEKLMGKNTVLFILISCLQVMPAYGGTITKLLEAASSHPNVKISELAVQEGNLRTEAANAALYPKVNLFGKASYYDSPTNLRPMTPAEAASGGSLPFSRPIASYGISFQAPLYVSKIFRLREKLALLSHKSEIARQINLVNRQAAVVSLNSAYHYLSELDIAIDARLKSLAQTHDDLALKVKNGRTPEAELMKIDNSIITLQEQKNDLADKILNVQRDLKNFTDLVVDEPVPMNLAEMPAEGKIIGLTLEKTSLAAQEKEVERSHAERLPALVAHGTLSGNDGEAYNTESHIFREYSFAGVELSVPLFDKTLSTDESIAIIAAKKARQRLKDTEIELMAREKNLKARLPVVEKSRQLAEKSVKNNADLLNIARVSYDSGRTTTEEYLRYEAQVFTSQANLAGAIDAKWQIITKLAVLYGTDLRGVVK